MSRLRLPVPALIAALGLLCACRGEPPPHHPDWVIHGRLEFLAADLASGWHPPAYRLVFPYICGDLYGAPTTGDFIRPAITADGRFRIDLNRTHATLLQSLEPTDFSLSYLRITPPQARLARLAPTAFELGGIEQVGRAQWIDGRSHRMLLLVYVDRPARISGQTLIRGRSVRFDVQARAANYIWIEDRRDSAGDVYREVPAPSELILAVTPLESASGQQSGSGQR